MRFIILGFFLACIYTNAQVNISGTVVNNKGEAIQGASIVASTLTGVIDSYSYTNDDGIYNLKVKNDSVLIKCLALGFHTKEILYTQQGNNKREINFVLQPKPFELKEVIIKAEMPISVNKDTINFKTKFFTNGTEQNRRSI